MTANTYVALDKITVVSATSSITFSSIPSTYTDLVIVSNFGTTASGNSVGLRFNGDTGSNYSTTQVNAPTPFGGSWRGTNQTSSTVFGSPIASGTPSTLIAYGTINIPNYSKNNINKSILSRYGYGSGEVIGASGLWRNTNAITSITLVCVGTTLLAGSTFELYGILAEGVSPTTKATGGAVYSDSTYYYHVFGASGTFTPTQSITADYIVVAGGGGGGAYIGAGGGAGGLRSTISSTGGGGSLESALSLTAQPYTVTVGAGGAAGLYSGLVDPGNGTNSTFSTITSTGGGRGGHVYATAAGGSGGSGGGGAGGGDVTTSGGAGTSNQGFAGGTKSGPNDAGAGGGGAGAVGINRTGISDGQGGAGVYIPSVFAATGVGVSGYLAGGGGGGFANANGVLTLGGAGGGGIGGRNTGSVDATSGISNTGSGGGGTGKSASNGGAGGSGVVVIRYAK